jgi:hypothetical protein
VCYCVWLFDGIPRGWLAHNEGFVLRTYLSVNARQKLPLLEVTESVSAQNFQKSRSSLKTRGTRKVNVLDITNIGSRVQNSSLLGFKHPSCSGHLVKIIPDTFSVTFCKFLCLLWLFLRHIVNCQWKWIFEIVSTIHFANTVSFNQQYAHQYSIGVYRYTVHAPRRFGVRSPSLGVRSQFHLKTQTPHGT